MAHAEQHWKGKFTTEMRLKNSSIKPHTKSVRKQFYILNHLWIVQRWVGVKFVCENVHEESNAKSLQKENQVEKVPCRHNVQ